MGSLVNPEHIVKGPERTWHGMTELYVRDPDGYIVRVGSPDEAPNT